MISRLRFHYYFWLIVFIVFLPARVLASLIYVPNTYGLSARSIALVNAITADDEDISLAYYGPAGLAEAEGFNFALGYIYTTPHLSGGIKGGTKVEERYNNRIVSMGLTADIAGTFFQEPKFKLGFGMNLTADDNFRTLMAFNDLRRQDGEFYRYGLSNFSIQSALGFGPMDWFSIGVGFHGGFRGNGEVFTEADVSEYTLNEGTAMYGKLIPVFLGGARVFGDSWAVGVTYRHETYGTFEPIDVTATPLISGVPMATMYLPLNFFDTFVPHQVATGVKIEVADKVNIFADLTWCDWSAFAEKSESDQYVGSLSDYKTSDVWVPKIAMEIEAFEHFDARWGYRYEQTPFETIGTRHPLGLQDINGKVILDNDVHVGSVGGGYTFSYPETFKLDFVLDFAYQFQYLVPRTVRTSDGFPYESEGYLHMFTGSLTFDF